jgi:hypothetical protein
MQQLESGNKVEGEDGGDHRTRWVLKEKVENFDPEVQQIRPYSRGRGVKIIQLLVRTSHALGLLRGLAGELRNALDVGRGLIFWCCSAADAELYASRLLAITLVKKSTNVREMPRARWPLQGLC